MTKDEQREAALAADGTTIGKAETVEGIVYRLGYRNGYDAATAELLAYKTQVEAMLGAATSALESISGWIGNDADWVIKRADGAFSNSRGITGEQRMSDYQPTEAYAYQPDLADANDGYIYAISGPFNPELVLLNRARFKTRADAQAVADIWNRF